MNVGANQLREAAGLGLKKGSAEDCRLCGSLKLDPRGPEIVDFADSAAIVGCWIW